MPAVEQIVVPLGLLTEPNPMGQYPAGALAIANGVVLRSPGLLTKAPLFGAYNANPFITTSPCTPALLGVSDSQFFHVSQRNADSHWELTFFDGATKFGNDLNGAGLPYQPITFDTTAKINTTRSVDRILVNSLKGVLVVDNTAPASNAAALPRHAGIPPTTLNPNVITSGNPSAIAAGRWVAVVCVVRRVLANGREITSAPSAPMGTGTAALADLQHQAAWGTNHQLIVGDILEFYRTPSQPLGSEVGATFYKTLAYRLTSTDIVAGNVTGLLDKQTDAQLGEELYANPGQTGASSAKNCPPLAACMATFKGYTFYGNRTDAASITLAIPGGMRTNVTDASNLSIRQSVIGPRSFTATFTNTSNTLTAISANDMIGLAVGQVIIDAALVGGSGTVTSVTASTVVLNTTANTTVTKSAVLTDQLVINGTTINAGSPQYYIPQLVNDVSVRTLLMGPDVAAATGSIGILKQFAILKQRAGGGSFTIAASNPQNYLPPLPATTATALTVSQNIVSSGIAWSEQSQPEAVPPFNQAPVGSGTIYAMLPTRDALWIFASDGLWRLTGTGGQAGRGFDWRIDPVDSTLSLSGPHAACVGRDTVYAYTNRGLVSISSAGINDTLSVGKINDILPGPPFSATTSIQIAYDETNDEVWLFTPYQVFSKPSYLIYNTLTRAWTTSPTGNVGSGLIPAYARFAQRMGDIGTGAAYLQSTTQFEGSAYTVTYQPVFTQDPSSLKQWIDATLIASAADVGKSAYMNFNAQLAATPQLMKAQYSEARCSWSIPRNAPAVSNSLQPTVALGAGDLTSFSLYGIILRSEILTNQRKQR
jgi:hypothetical protein